MAIICSRKNENEKSLAVMPGKLFVDTETDLVYIVGGSEYNRKYNLFSLTRGANYYGESVSLTEMQKEMKLEGCFEDFCGSITISNEEC